MQRKTLKIFASPGAMKPLARTIADLIPVAIWHNSIDETLLAGTLVRVLQHVPQDVLKHRLDGAI